MKEAPIGVFDSGVGGLSVLREIHSQLRCEDLLYVADSGAAPYGDRTESFIQERVDAIVDFFNSKNVKALVIACNTATAVAVRAIRSRLDIPVVAMEPAVKPATNHTRSKVIGVLATSRTLQSTRFFSLIDRYRSEAEIILQPCPGFVEQVEKGDLTGPETRDLVTRYISPLIKHGVDTIVLGCTHYPFLLPMIQEISGPAVRVMDSSAPVARQLYRRLEADQLLSPKETLGEVRFWTSGDPEKVQPVISKLWGSYVLLYPLPSQFSVPDPS